MWLRRAVPKIPPKSPVLPRLPLYKSRPLPTRSKSTLPQMLIPLHFNSPRINTYKKQGRGSLLSALEFYNSSLPAPHYTHAKQHPPVSFTSLTSLTSFTSSTSFASPSVTPFPVTLASHLQIAENKTTLSPAVVTLTGCVKHKSFVCHSCKKHGGWGTTSYDQQKRALGLRHIHPLGKSPAANRQSLSILNATLASGASGHPRLGVAPSYSPRTIHYPLLTALFKQVRLLARDAVPQRLKLEPAHHRHAHL